MKPRLSVIVPVHDEGEALGACLEAVAASDLERSAWELIVVDDGSTDDSSLIAAPYADTIVRLAGNPRGAAYAWNRGAEVSRADVLLFLHADVRVRNDTLSSVLAALDARPEVSAVYGCCDPASSGPGLVSRYRNLVQAFDATREVSAAAGFWAGCGAVRRNAFFEIGMFDEWHHSTALVADLELGRRLHRLHYRVERLPTTRVEHARRWTLGQLFGPELTRRVIPALWLHLHEKRSRRRGEPLSTARVHAAAQLMLAVGAVAAGLFVGGVAPFACAGLALGGVLFLERGFWAFAGRHGGVGLVLRLLPLHLAHIALVGVAVIIGWILRDLIGKPQPPADAEARAAIGVSLWPPVPSRPTGSIWDLPAGTRKRRAAIRRAQRRNRLAVGTAPER